MFYNFCVKLIVEFSIDFLSSIYYFHVPMQTKTVIVIMKLLL